MEEVTEFGGRNSSFENFGLDIWRTKVEGFGNIKWTLYDLKIIRLRNFEILNRIGIWDLGKFAV